jgi:hypothetical protein
MATSVPRESVLGLPKSLLLLPGEGLCLWPLRLLLLNAELGCLVRSLL